MNNKYLIIFFIIFLIICFFILLNYLFGKKYIEKFSQKDTIQILQDKEIKYTDMHNLIKNGNFSNGKDITNHINQNGYNKIIMKKNPGDSSYVLEQKKTDNLTYYELICDNEKNSKYILYFWMSVEMNKPIDSLDFEKLIKIKIQNDDFSNYMPKLNYNIIQKIIMNNTDNNTWYLIKYDFISGSNTSDKMQIYINYSEHLMFDEYYFTNILLYKVLIDAENFIYNNKLISYVDGYHYESNTPTWHDLSGVGNDLFWSNIPDADYTKGSLNTSNKKLIGFPSNKLLNNNFSILICLNKNYENIASDNYINEEDSVTKFYLLSLPGNDRYSFEIEIRDNYLYLIQDNDEYKSTSELIIYNKSLLAIIYDDNKINIYQDGINILSVKNKKLYFSNDSLVLNRNKNLNYNFYSLLFYNRIILKKELDDIREYFITNKNKNFNTPDINIYHMNQNAEYTVNNDNNTDNFLFKPYNKKMNIPYDNLESNSFVDTFDNQNNINCSKDCLDLCNKFLTSGNMNKYNECINSCKNVLLSCQNFCDDSNNKNSVYCNTVDNKSNCPKVYKKDNNYMVHVGSNNPFSGEKSYGKNLDKARYTYNINFPECPTPPELMPGGGKNYLDKCPYIINEANPCHTNVCAGVNWGVKDYHELNLNKNCKKSVSNYCQINYNLDENCFCWNPKNKDNKECIEFRRHFEDPNDYCSPNQFKIEEHPEFDKYIKKDNIPCWGCNLNM